MGKAALGSRSKDDMSLPRNMGVDGEAPTSFEELTSRENFAATEDIHKSVQVGYGFAPLSTLDTLHTHTPKNQWVGKRRAIE